MNDYIDFSSSERIREYLNECFRVQSDMDKELSEIHIGFFNPEKETLKRRKRLLKERLRKIGNNIKKCRDLFESYTNFDADIFLSFLKEYLTLKENENYELLLNIEEYNYTMAIATKTFPLNLFGDHYNIVTTEENCEILEECQGSWGLADIDDIDDFLRNLDNDNYICLAVKDNYTLLYGITLDGAFESYPYLYDVANELVDMKLENPDMSDEERLEIILDKLRKKKGIRRKSNILKPDFWR